MLDVQSQSAWGQNTALICRKELGPRLLVHLLTSHPFSFFLLLCASVGDTHRRVLRCVSEHALVFLFTLSIPKTAQLIVNSI